MRQKFFQSVSSTSLLQEKSKNKISILNHSLGDILMNNNIFFERCCARLEEGKQQLKEKLTEARIAFFSKEDMANWLFKIKEDAKRETDRIYCQYDATFGGDQQNIDFEKVGYLAGIFDAAEEYLETITFPEPVGQNKAHFLVYDRLEKLDTYYLRTDEIPGYYQIQKNKLIKKHEFEVKNLDDSWEEYLSLGKTRIVIEGFGDKQYLLDLYHREFAWQLLNIRPLSDVKLMLDFHYKKYDGILVDFLNHIEYRVLPMLESWANTNYIIYRKLFWEWLKEKSDNLSTADQNFLIKCVDSCCAAFLNSLAIHRPLKDENKYNTVIKDLIQKSISSKFWVASDQSLGGFTDSISLAPKAGIAERDLIIYNEEQQIISSVEFFRLSHIPGNIEADSVLKSHLLKIFRNEITGISPLFMIVYCETKSFDKTWEKYLSFTESLDFGDYRKIRVEPEVPVTPQRANLKMGFSEHYRGTTIIRLYHIFINMFP